MEWIKTKQIAEQYAKEAIEIYRNKLTDNNKNASKNLYNNLRFEVIITDEELKVVLYLENYYKYVEMGRRPNSKFPPIDKIEEWIIQKPIHPYPNSNGTLPTTKQLAFLISRSIAVNGIEPTYYLSSTIEELEDKYIPLLEEAIEEDAINYALIDFDTLLLT